MNHFILTKQGGGTYMNVTHNLIMLHLQNESSAAHCKNVRYVLLRVSRNNSKLK